MEQHCGEVSGVDEGVCGWWVREGEKAILLRINGIIMKYDEANEEKFEIIASNL